MKALKIIIIVVSSLLLIGGAGYLYASSGIKSKPGYAKLTTPNGKSIDALFSVNVGPRGVKPARWLFEQIVENSDYALDQVPEQMLNNAVQELQGVQLRVYDVGAHRQVFDDAFADSVAALKSKNWTTLATVREDDVKIAVLQYEDGAQIAGLSIIASTPDKAIFLNLIGPFNLGTIEQSQSNSRL